MNPDKNNDRCPCGMNGSCCANTDIIPHEHICSEDEICEGCYGRECRNCGAVCYHEI